MCVEIWKYGNMCYNMEIWKYGNTEIWKYGMEMNWKSKLRSRKFKTEIEN